MGKLTMFMFDGCPYCKKAESIQRRLLQEEKYGTIQIEQIDEHLQPELAAQFDYYYVPSYFLGRRKLHEGAAGEAEIRAVLDAVLENQN